jgi:hypothetical protein
LFFVRMFMIWLLSMYCKKNSDNMAEEEAPIAKPVFWCQ